MSLDRTHRADAGSGGAAGFGGGRRDLAGLWVGVGLTVVAVGDGRCRVGGTVRCVDVTDGVTDGVVGAGSWSVVAGPAAE